MSTDIDDENDEDTVDVPPAARANGSPPAAPPPPKTAPRRRGSRSLEAEADDAVEHWTQPDAISRWGEVKEKNWRIFKRGPEDITMYIYRTDPAPTTVGAGMTSIGTIHGNHVQGENGITPQEQLLAHLINNVHASFNSPATYMVRFHSAATGRQVTEAKIALDHPQEIAKRQAAANAARAAQVSSGFQVGYPLYTPQGSGLTVNGMGAQMPYANGFPIGAGGFVQPGAPAGPPVGMFPPAPPPIPAGADFETMSRISREYQQQAMDWAEKMYAARLAGAAGVPQTVATPPAPVNEETIVAKTTAAVIAALQEAGVVKKPGAPATTEEVVEAVMKRIGAGAVNASVQAQPVAGVGNIIAAARKALGEIQALDGMKKEFASALGLEVDDGGEEEETAVKPPGEDDDLEIIPTDFPLFGRPFNRVKQKTQYDAETREKIEHPPLGIWRDAYEHIKANPQIAEKGIDIISKTGAGAVARAVDVATKVVAKVAGVSQSADVAPSGSGVDDAPLAIGAGAAPIPPGWAD